MLNTVITVYTYIIIILCNVCYNVSHQKVHVDDKICVSTTAESADGRMTHGVRIWWFGDGQLWTGVVSDR